MLWYGTTTTVEENVVTVVDTASCTAEEEQAHHRGADFCLVYRDTFYRTYVLN
jgi:hypothetical protein